MKKVLFLSLLVVFFFIAISNTYSQMPRLINYQGELIGANNNALPGHSNAVTSAMLEQKFGDQSIWTEPLNVRISNLQINIYISYVKLFYLHCISTIFIFNNY